MPAICTTVLVLAASASPACATGTTGDVTASAVPPTNAGRLIVATPAGSAIEPHSDGRTRSSGRAAGTSADSNQRGGVAL